MISKKILISKINTIWLLVCLILLLITTDKVTAQTQNSFVFYVGDNAEAHFSLASFNLDLSFSEMVTSRTSGIHGKISFATDATWYVASNSHYIDGFAHTYSDAFFVFPIGQLGVYAPLRIIPINTSGVSAAYYRQSPEIVGSALAPNLTVLSSTEYWLLEGALAMPKVTLSWRASSNIAVLTGNSLAKLTIAGWNGTEWHAIASTIDYIALSGDPSTLEAGSISTIDIIDLSQYTAFSLAKRGDICLPYIASSGDVKTWNNGWTPSLPTLNDPVIINSSFSGDLLCNSLVLNADITLVGTQSVAIVNGVTGNGMIIMSSEASVVQHNAASLAPKIALTKVTHPMRRYDYVFLSSPINDSAVFYNNLTNSNNVAVNGSFGSQPLSAFSNFKTLNQIGQQVTVTSFTIGKGLRALVRNQAPFSTTGTWITEKNPISIKTMGTANNGDVAVDLPANNWAFIGNPYPSAIDSQLLLDAGGSNLGSTIYYWTYNSPMSSLFTYTINDWATWTSAGGTAACLTCEKPDGSIASMQSVYVKSMSVTATTFNFTNCMRKAQGNSNFYRTISNNRFWLNMEGSNGSFNQILLAYSDDTVIDEDASDGLKMTGTASALSSFMNDAKYAIQGRGLFDDTDIVPLAIDKSNTEQFTISLGDKEGLFVNEATPIYLHDAVLGIYHDLSLGDYSFALTTNSDVTRFTIRYANALLNDTDYDTVKTVVFINNANLSVNASAIIVNVMVYDLVGRRLESYDNQGTTTLSQPFHHTLGIYVAKITFEDGTVVSQKIYNK